MKENMKLDAETSVKAPRWKADSFVLVLLAFSLALNAYLGVKIKNLSAANDTVNPTAAIGSFLETLDAHTTEGEPQTIRLTAGKAAVIYIFSPECRWCERNLPNITYLAAKRNEEYDFIGLSLSRRSLDVYLKTHKLPFVVYAQPSAPAQKLMQIAGTPQTVVVSSNGRILHNWVGAYRDSIQHEVEAEFKVLLPGLTAKNWSERGGN
jgi:hypothetical protein